MATKARKRRKTFNEINITPLTDIFLVLLIIMMVVAPMLDQQGLSLAVPTSQEVTKEENKDSKILIVDVNTEGQYFIEEQLMERDDLLAALKEQAKEKEGGLLIRADGNSTHGAIVKVMDYARTAGILSISLVEE